jgi:hypothetical protein
MPVQSCTSYLASRNQRAVIELAADNLTGTCGEALTTRGVPSGEVWLFSVSISRMNFSASMGVASLIRLGTEQLRPPLGAIRGPYALPVANWGIFGRRSITT